VVQWELEGPDRGEGKRTQRRLLVRATCNEALDWMLDRLVGVDVADKTGLGLNRGRRCRSFAGDDGLCLGVKEGPLGIIIIISGGSPVDGCREMVEKRNY